MPLDTVRIRRVDRSSTIREGLYRYDIEAETVSEPIRLKQYQTVNAWKASGCEQARKMGLVVTIGSRETKYGLEVITIEFVDERRSPDGDGPVVEDRAREASPNVPDRGNKVSASGMRREVAASRHLTPVESVSTTAGSEPADAQSPTGLGRVEFESDQKAS